MEFPLQFLSEVFKKIGRLYFFIKSFVVREGEGCTCHEKLPQHAKEPEKKAKQLI